MPRSSGVIGLRDNAENTSTARRGRSRVSSSLPNSPLMPVDQMVDAPVQSEERVAMRRQDEHIVRNAPTDMRQGAQPVGQGIRLRLKRLDRDIGRDARQYLVARYEELESGAVERGMFGRMARTHHHLPIMLPNPDLIAIRHALEGVGDGIEQLAEFSGSGARPECR